VDRLPAVDEEIIDFIDFKDRDINIRILLPRWGYQWNRVKTNALFLAENPEDVLVLFLMPYLCARIRATCDYLHQIHQ